MEDLCVIHLLSLFLFLWYLSSLCLSSLLDVFDLCLMFMVFDHLSLPIRRLFLALDFKVTHYSSVGKKKEKIINYL